MNNTALLEKLDCGWVLSQDQSGLVKIVYDTIPVNRIFAVKLKTGNYTILQKTEKFDDALLKVSENYESTISFLKQNA